MESHGLVQGEGPFVRVGCVHQYTSGAPPRRPPQGVQCQGTAKTLALLVGVHSQSLEKSLPGVASGHGVGAKVAGRPGAVSGGSPTGVGNGSAVERPTGSERGAVHAGDGCVLPGKQSARATVRFGRLGGCVVLQQYELLDHVKPCALDAQRGGGGERAGSHETKPSTSQHGAPRLDLFGGGRSLLLVHQEMSGEGL